MAVQNSHRFAWYDANLADVENPFRNAGYICAASKEESLSSCHEGAFSFEYNRFAWFGIAVERISDNYITEGKYIHYRNAE